MIMRMTINCRSDHGVSISSALSVPWWKREQWMWKGRGYFALALKFTPASPGKFVSGDLLNIIHQYVTHRELVYLMFSESFALIL